MNQELEQESQTQLDECKKQAEEYLNGWKRAKADLINFQKQTEKEKEDWFSFAQANFVLAILPVMDSLESAVAHKTGIEKIRDQMVDILKRMGVKEIKSLGEPLNPEFHEVVGKELAEDKVPGLVIKEAQKGYLLNDRVLRPAKVIVSE